MNFSAVSVLLAFFLNGAENARILGIFPMRAKSHYVLGRILMKALAEKGHEITFISPFEETDNPKNWKNVVLTGFQEEFQKVAAKHNLIEKGNEHPIFYTLFLNYLGSKISDRTLNHTNVQNFLKSNAEFDVVIIDQMAHEALKVFANHFNCPLVLLLTSAITSTVNSLVANPAPPSYVFDNWMNHEYFFDRLKNALIVTIGELNKQFLLYPQQDKIMKKYFPNAPDLNKINYNASLVLINSHFSIYDAFPRVPNMIDIGGYHLQTPKKLPKDLQDFMDNAKDGVIYFSMGSFLRSVDLSIQKQQAIIKTFAKLKEKVLWKWESDDLQNKPPNVKIAKWFPQQEILAHPNLKVFVTHGGLLSIMEATYHGIPVLSIPILGEHKLNANYANKNEYGLILPYEKISEKKFTDKLNQLINNPKYYNNAKKRSKIFHDRPNKPLDTAVYWVEYVIRHQGAPHLRVAGLELLWYQYLLLDVIAFVLLAIIIILYFFFTLIKFVSNYRKSCSEKEKKL